MLPHDLRLCEFLMQGLFLSAMCEVRGFKLVFDSYVLQTSSPDILCHCLARVALKGNKPFGQQRVSRHFTGHMDNNSEVKSHFE